MINNEKIKEIVMKEKFALMEKRGQLVDQMEALVSAEMTDEQRSAYDSLAEQVAKVDEDITRYEKMNSIKEKGSVTILKDTKKDDEEVNFLRAFSEYYTDNRLSSEFRAKDGGILIPKSIYRADPLLTTTNTAIINKTVGALNIKMTPGESFVRALGVNILTGLNGNFVLPSAPEVTAGFVSENGDVSTGSFAPANVTLAPRGVGVSQTWTREYASQINPDIAGTMIQAMLNAVWVEVAKDLFVQIKADAAVSQKGHVGGSLSYSTLLGMEASIGYMMARPAFVMGRALKGYLRGLNASSAGIKFTWTDDNAIAGYPAFSESVVPSTNVFFGDFADAYVGQWEDLSLILDPYTYAASRKVKATVNGLFDSGYANPKGLCWIADASTY
jgi:hypothetical protein